MIGFARTGIMRRKTIIRACAVACVTVCTVAGWASQREESIQTWKQLFAGLKYEQAIVSGDLERIPSWSPEREPCPLLSTNAIALARRQLTDALPGVSWRLGAVAIRRTSLRNNTKWHYSITFVSDVKSAGKGSRSFKVIVTMDGHVPEIVGKPNDFKARY
jgi:hypothetical protein